MRRFAHQLGSHDVALGVDVVGEHAVGCRDDQGGVLGGVVVVAHRDGGVGDGAHLDGDGGGFGGALSIGRGEREAVGSVEVVVGGVGELGRVAGQRAVAGVGSHGELHRVVLHVGGGQGDRDGRVFWRVERLLRADRGVVHRGHEDLRGDGVGDVAVGVDGVVAERVGAGVVRSGRVAEPTIVAQVQRAVRRCDDEDGAKLVVGGVDVVGEHAGRGSHVHGDVLVGAVGAVRERVRRAHGGDVDGRVAVDGDQAVAHRAGGVASRDPVQHGTRFLERDVHARRERASVRHRARFSSGEVADRDPCTRLAGRHVGFDGGVA